MLKGKESMQIHSNLFKGQLLAWAIVSTVIFVSIFKFYFSLKCYESRCKLDYGVSICSLIPPSIAINKIYSHVAVYVYIKQDFQRDFTLRNQPHSPVFLSHNTPKSCPTVVQNCKTVCFREMFNGKLLCRHIYIYKLVQKLPKKKLGLTSPIFIYTYFTWWCKCHINIIKIGQRV